MALQLRITLNAAAQIETVDRWWSENRPSAPRAVTDDLRAAFELLMHQPGIGTRVAGKKTQGVRRLHLGRIRYHLFYRIKGNELVVLSLWHSSRDSPHTF